MNIRKRYSQMTPEEQRAVDERDVAILDMKASGATYREMRDAFGVTDPTIRRVIKNCGEAVDD